MKDGEWGGGGKQKMQYVVDCVRFEIPQQHGWPHVQNPVSKHKKKHTNWVLTKTMTVAFELLEGADKSYRL